jgi:hypothetical protein
MYSKQGVEKDILRSLEVKNFVFINWSERTHTRNSKSTLFFLCEDFGVLGIVWHRDPYDIAEKNGWNARQEKSHCQPARFALAFRK